MKRQVKLRAPMDGVVKIINNHPGERLPAGKSRNPRSSVSAATWNWSSPPSASGLR